MGFDDELKPCPFCGGKAELVSKSSQFSGLSPVRWYVHCPNYCCKQYPQMSDHDAIEMWNMRRIARKEPIQRTALVGYKGYTGKIIQDSDDEGSYFHGVVIGITDLLVFEGKTLEEAEQSFHDIIDDYFGVCDEIGKVPEKSDSLNGMDSRPLQGYLDELPNPKTLREKLAVASASINNIFLEILDLLKNYDDSGHDAHS